MNEVKAVHQLIRDLKELGYPEESIRLEFPISIGKNQRKYADVAIIDPTDNDVVAIVEVKARRNVGDVIDQAALRVLEYAKLLPNNPLSLIYITDGTSKEFGQVQEKGGSPIIIPTVPSFNSLLTGSRAQRKVETKEKSKRITDRFSLLCRGLATGVGIVLALDLVEVYSFSPQQLTLLGAVVGLLVIPYAAKLKLFGMEFERYRNEKAKDS